MSQTRTETVTGAGHAFDNHRSTICHQLEPAAIGWDLTTCFLAQNLPVSG